MQLRVTGRVILLEFLQLFPREQVGARHAVAVLQPDEPVHREVAHVREDAVLQPEHLLGIGELTLRLRHDDAGARRGPRQQIGEASGHVPRTGAAHREADAVDAVGIDVVLRLGDLDQRQDLLLALHRVPVVALENEPLRVHAHAALDLPRATRPVRGTGALASAVQPHHEALVLAARSGDVRPHLLIVGRVENQLLAALALRAVLLERLPERVAHLQPRALGNLPDRIRLRQQLLALGRVPVEKAVLRPRLPPLRAQRLDLLEGLAVQAIRGSGQRKEEQAAEQAHARILVAVVDPGWFPAPLLSRISA